MNGELKFLDHARQVGFFASILKRLCCEDGPIVKYENELPPEFVITEHANERLQARVLIKPCKLRKIIVKAWHNKQPVNPRLLDKLTRKPEYRNKHYRWFNGYIFVFSIRYNKTIGFAQKILVTVFHPRMVERAQRNIDKNN